MSMENTSIRYLKCQTTIGNRRLIRRPRQIWRDNIQTSQKKGVKSGIIEEPYRALGTGNGDS